MDYFKFAGLSIFAFLLIVVANILLAGADAPTWEMLAVSVAAISMAGGAFVLTPPKHLKFGYSMWILVCVILLIATRISVEVELRFNQGVSPAMVGFGWSLLWLSAIIFANPVCYWLGKKLAERFKKTSAGVATEFD